MGTKTKIFFIIVLFILVVGVCVASFFIGRMGKDKVDEQLKANIARTEQLETTVSDLKKSEKKRIVIIANLKKEQQRQTAIVESVREENIQLKKLNQQDGNVIRELSEINQKLSSSINNIGITGETVEKLAKESLSILQNEIDNK